MAWWRDRVCLLLSLFLLAAPAFSATPCPLEESRARAADSPHCYFYQGTAAYRAKDFKLAAQHWNSLLVLQNLPVDERFLQDDARNNLGFLHYRGLGVAVSRDTAIKLWNVAFDAGHDEAAYHLCHTYADRKSGSFDPVLGPQYCREALRRYTADHGKGENNEVVRQIRTYLKK
jgi:TPR repeat protein